MLSASSRARVISRRDATGAAPRVGELGYWIGEAFQGHGYTREAVPHLLRLAFARLRVDRIEAGAQPGNVASFRVMRGLGMEPVGPRQVWAPAREREETCRYFAISRADFDAARESHRGS